MIYLLKLKGSMGTTITLQSTTMYRLLTGQIGEQYLSYTQAGNKFNNNLTIYIEMKEWLGHQG